jgi:hypothetical protein
MTGQLNCVKLFCTLFERMSSAEADRFFLGSDERRRLANFDWDSLSPSLIEIIIDQLQAHNYCSEHYQLAYFCIDRLIHKGYYYGYSSYIEDNWDPAQTYARRYWAKHLSLCLPFADVGQRSRDMLQSLASRFIGLNLDVADAYLVVQWLKVWFS